ncbi:MAG: ABC transporter ATP-binding protein [Clostridia bacterium]|nr:ABC transporter ATP-binding protein [Clostridia bacterium]
MTEPLLIVKNLCLDIRKDGRAIPILRDVGFELKPGERKGIAGESGAGKSMTMHCLTALIPRNICDIRGEILFRDGDGRYTDALKLPWPERQRFCAGKISLILQDSINALNPFIRIETQWAETARLHRPDMDKAKVREHLLRTMDAFGIPGGVETLRKYPHQLSGGMRQRIAIGMALESDAPILIADEPTTSLDTINQRKVVEFIEALCAARGLSMLYITHNLGIVQAICDSAIVMKDGRIVEQGATRDLFASPADPYTRQLIEGTRGLRR